jgi:hypothetical protein
MKSNNQVLNRYHRNKIQPIQLIHFSKQEHFIK